MKLSNILLVLSGLSVVTIGSVIITVIANFYSQLFGPKIHPIVSSFGWIRFANGRTTSFFYSEICGIVHVHL